ncbi:MAG: serine--tRNA ligase [Alphaproteobacteria bacterium]|nr:serine--tRNA ligase [Alphaproteobacteria bacterium]
MHDIRSIREAPDAFDAGLARRGLPAQAAELVALDARRRASIAASETAQARRKALSRQIGQARGKGEDASALMAEVAELEVTLKAGEAEAAALDGDLVRRLALLPNLPADDVPDGIDEHGNVEIRRVGTPRAFAFEPKDHVALGEAMGGMDFAAASKLSGARFVVLKGGLARLERALAAFMLDAHTQENGYTEVSPPLLVRDDALYGTSQLPKFTDEQFIASRQRSRQELLEAALDHVSIEDGQALRRGEIGEKELVMRAIERAPTREDFWLIPTAEVPLTNLVREQVLDEKALPLRFTAGTPCFRSEAGAAGKDTRGMIRQHQFTKVELVSITAPDQSAAEHERMTACAEGILTRLGLPFRTVVLCGGDMGFGARKTYDIEVWLPGQNAYREISSCSNCGDFQARRMAARFRPKEGKGTQFVHTLNGSGLAVGRTLIAVLENYQNADGTVTVPQALQPYMGGQSVLGAK